MRMMSEDEIRDEVLRTLKVGNEVVTFLSISAKFNVHVDVAKRILDKLYKEYKDEENLRAIFYLSGYQKVGENELHRVFFVNDELIQEHMDMLDVVLSCHTYCVQVSEIKDLIASYIVDENVSLPLSHRPILPLSAVPEREIHTSPPPKTSTLTKQRSSSDRIVTTPPKDLPAKISHRLHLNDDKGKAAVLNAEPFPLHNGEAGVSLSKVDSEHTVSNDLFTAESSPESSPRKRSKDKGNKSSEEKRRRAERKGKKVKTSKINYEQQISPEPTACGISGERVHLPNSDPKCLEEPPVEIITHETKRRKTGFKTFLDDDDYLVTKRVHEMETAKGNDSADVDPLHSGGMEEDNDTSEPAPRKRRSNAAPKKKQNPLTHFFKKL